MTEINPPLRTSNPIEAVRQWFALMERYCASVDYDGAEGIFAEDVVSFGTTMDIVSGRKTLRRGQWESIWGNISNFKMDLDNVHAHGSGNQAWGVVTWTSVGFDGDHQPFYRPGRATVTLELRDGVWLAVHTHFSLYPGTPQRTFGKKPRCE
jgi:ketosteroid isomerase-like protein